MSAAAAEGNANCFLEKKRKLLPPLPIDHKMKLFDKMSAIMSFPEAPQCFSFRLQIFQICLWFSNFERDLDLQTLEFSYSLTVCILSGDMRF